MGEPRLQRARGRVELGFGVRAGACRLLHHLEQGCAKARFPRPVAGAMPEVVLLNTAGGLTDGDRIDQVIDVGPAGGLSVTTQAAEKIYRARQDPASMRTTVTIGAGATLFWLPQETILFDAARLDRRLAFELDADSVLVAAECLILGRTERGEVVHTGSLLDHRDLRICGRLRFADRFRLGGDVEACRATASLLGDARAMATLLVVGARDLVDVLRDVAVEPGVRVGASWRDPVLVLRLLGTDALALRSSLVRLIEPILARLTPGLALPRVWLC